MTSPDWIIGRGLLGGSLARALDEAVFVRKIRWGAEDASVDDLATGLEQFLEAGGTRRIYWTAGAGVTASGAEALTTEVRVFERFLESLSQFSEADRADVSVFLASSVGGAYAGNPSPPFTEQSPARALSAYGRAKLDMENALSDHVARSGGRALIGRITNLYGPGQNLAKGQGLISVIAKTYLTGQPASIFVPLDTIRNYIYVEDCAAMVIAAMTRLGEAPPGTAVTKIMGSSVGVTIASVIGEFTRVMKRRPLIVLGAGDASGQASDLRVDSNVWPELDAYASTALGAGIERTYSAMLKATAASAL